MLTVNQQAVSELSAQLIIRYYENDYMPFLLHMDDDALWYGPAEGQFLHGREAMINAWNAEEHPLRFSLGNLEVTHNSSHPSHCNVVLTYSVVTHYPSGQDIALNQRTLLCWCERTIGDGESRERVPRILLCDISNPHGKHEDDTIYPTNFENIYSGHHALAHSGKRLQFHGADRSEFFFLSDSVMWIEAAHGSKHSIIYTDEGAVEVLSSVAELEKRYSRFFLRCHQSYLVNPDFIRSIKRFRLTLEDGTELPIPEKKYTAFRDKVDKIRKQQQKRLSQ